MQFSLTQALCAVALFGLSNAQTPAGFTPAVSQTLSVTYNTTAVQNGATLPKDLTQTIPRIATTAGRTGTFLFLVMDLDVPVRTGDAITGRTTLLHALVPGYTASANGSLSSPNIASAPAPYIGPNPPAENPAKPHRYVELLFNQPSNFAVPASQASAISARRDFNLTAFSTAANLTAPIAANYFLVVNNTVTPGAASATGTGAASRPTTTASANSTLRASSTTTARPSQFTGAAHTAAGSLLGALFMAGAAIAF